MILTITANAALDITYTVARVTPQTSHRVTQVQQRAGGKGINVSSVLALLGVANVATGLIGGSTGQVIARDLETRGITHRLFGIGEESRRTINVVGTTQDDSTIFNEPGPHITTQDWEGLLHAIQRLLTSENVSVVVAAGSLPPGAPKDAYRTLTDLARASGALSVIDAAGDALMAALAAGPDVIKPNRAELSAVVGLDDPVEAAHQLQGRGARTVVASLGAQGVVVIPPGESAYWSWLQEPQHGNPTGAGDAMVAAVAAGLSAGESWPQIITDAVACSAGAVLQPLAGTVDPEDITRLKTLVRVKQLAAGSMRRP